MSGTARSNTKYMQIPQSGKENNADQSQLGLSPDGKIGDQSL